jgi:hypothetical protein
MTPMIAIKDGVVRLSGNGYVMSDGTVRILGQPIAVRAKCEAAGLDPRKVQEDGYPSKYLARMGMNDGNVEILTEREYSARQRAERDKAAALLEAKINGLTEMRALATAVSRDAARYRHELDRMMSDEFNDGVNPPAPVDQSLRDRLSELKKTHPRAELYLRSEGAVNYIEGVKMGGNYARQLLRDGGSIEEAEAALLPPEKS